MKSFISVALAIILLLFSVETAFAEETDIETLNVDEYGKAVSQCVKEDNAETNSSDCDAQRVIGQANGDIDFSEYDAEEIILSEDGRFLLSFDSVEDAEKCIEDLSKDKAVLYAEADDSVEMCTEYETKSTKNLSWGTGAIQNDKLAECLKNVDFGRDVTVAIIDSGAADIDYLEGRVIEGYDFVDNDSDPSNDISIYSHGTFVSSIVVDNTCNLPIYIMPIRVISTESATISNVVNGIYYAVNNGADVINMSLGGEFTSCKSLDAAVEYAVSQNVAVVVSAGNGSKNTKYICPAHNESAITVSAIDSSLKFDESYSNYGSEVDFAAPGTNILGYDVNGDIITLDGTSMSTAFISASMAILKLLYPSASVDLLQSVLADSAVNPIGVNKNNYYGYGIPQMMFFSGYTNGGIFLVSDKKNFVPGENYSFYTYSLSNLSPIEDAEWTSSDKTVATIDSNGTINALKAGKTEIVCTSKKNNKTSKCVVSVKGIESISVTEAPKETVYVYKLEEFEPRGIELTVKYTDGSTDVVGDCSKMTFEGFDSNTAGRQRIKVKYYDAETEFDVSVGYLWWQLLIRYLLFGWIWY